MSLVSQRIPTTSATIHQNSVRHTAMPPNMCQMWRKGKKIRFCGCNKLSSFVNKYLIRWWTLWWQEGVHVCYGKLLLQVPLRQSSYPSYLWLLWQHGRKYCGQLTSDTGGRGQRPGDRVTCDNWAVTGQRGGYSYPGDHPNPLPPVQSGSHNLLSSPG